MNKAISFWQFLKANKIVIPILQRDYAQGRVGKEYLRNSFLQKIKDALYGNSTEGEKMLKLDFVYGAKEGKELNPLDGQQRLTTLWLLHWFIAYKSEELKEGVQKILLNFTYETRNSSKDFCEKLVTADLPVNKIDKLKTINELKEGEEPTDNAKKYLSEDELKKIIDPKTHNKLLKDQLFHQKKDEILRPHFVSTLIQNQTWFYSGWKQDPTVQGMLRMLGGSYTPIGNGTDIIDGLEEIFIETDKDRYKEYWEKLTDKKVIVFYHLPMQDYGLADDLYIKMNARGKPLSDFENFKADLIGYIYDMINKDQKNSDMWKELSKNLTKKLDTDWVDIFWSHQLKIIKDSKEDKKTEGYTGRIDEIFYAFINRIFWSELILAKKDNEDKIKFDNDKSYDPSFLHLNEKNEEKDDPLPSYKNFNVYKLYTDESNNLNVIKNLQTVLDRLLERSSDTNNVQSEIEDWFKNNWKHNIDDINTDDENNTNEGYFSFIPQYVNLKQENNGKWTITKISQRERILFFAVCKYLKEGEFEESSFKKWMRVVNNLISGVDDTGRPEIRNNNAVKNAIEFIGADSFNSHDVYRSLKDLDDKIRIWEVCKDKNFFKGKITQKTLSDAKEELKNVDFRPLLQESINIDKFSVDELIALKEVIEKYKITSLFERRKKEETEKACIILEDTNLENLINEAESIPEFHRSIGFLYKKNETSNNWDGIKEKINTAMKYFSNENNDGKKDDLKLLTKYFALLDSSELDKILNIVIFNNNKISWINLFSKLELLPITDKFFREEENHPVINQEETIQTRILKLLTDRDTLQAIRGIPKLTLRKDSDHPALYFFVTKNARKEDNAIYINYDERDKFLKSEGVEVEKSFKINKKNGEFLFFKGSSIEFKYEEKKFRWDIDGKIHSLDYSKIIETKCKSTDQIKNELRE